MADLKKVARRTAMGVGIGTLGLGALRFALPAFSSPSSVRGVDELSDEARALVEASLQGLDPAALWDMHTHLVGVGAGGTGCFASEAMQSHVHPIQRLQFDMYMASAGVTSLKEADQQFVARLKSLARGAYPEGKALLMAFDAHVTEDGEEDRSRSPFFVPNAYAAKVADAEERFGFIASVHPYRKDALERLRQAAEVGAVAVKWLPNAMGMDPFSPRCDAFYRVMKELSLVLISHTGVEQAVHAEDAQELGNPMRLRRALDAGVRVVAAHCATMGQSKDLSAPGHPLKSSFELFRRMLDENEHETLLFGGLSALTLRNRDHSLIHELLSDTAIHPRLVNGSDYPVIAVDPVISISALVAAELLDENDESPLRGVFVANSLLFDLVLKRRLRTLRAGEPRSFSPLVFESRRLFV